jgi:hypothetical protein
MEYDDVVESILDFATELSADGVDVADLSNALSDAGDVIWASYSQLIAKQAADPESGTVH